MTPLADVDVPRALRWAAGALGPVREVRELVGGRTSSMLALRTDAGEAVLRLMTREPWRTHGAGLTARESEVQAMLSGSGLPLPRTLALDADGSSCGHPAHLMTRLPGRVDLGRADPGSLDRLVTLLAAIHAVEPSIEVREYQSWAWEAKYVVPTWATDAGLWEDAFDLLRQQPPTADRCFLHRDFGPHNVLWTGEEITGVVDWVETSLGPPWLDVAHCCTNLALRHGDAAADHLAQAYAVRTGRRPQPFFDVMDVVGFLPPPGRDTLVTSPDELGRLEQRLATVLPRV